MTDLRCPYCAVAVDIDALPIVATRWKSQSSTGAGGGFLADLEDDNDDECESPPVKESVSGRPTLGELGGYPVLWQPSAETRRSVMANSAVPSVWDHGDKADRPARLCTSCRHPMLPEFGEVDMITIAIVGTPAAGKTHYLAKALQAIEEEQALASFGVSDFYATEATAQLLDEYRLALDVARTVVPKTAPEATRDVRFQPLSFRAKIGDDRYLIMFHDVAGEQFVNNDKRDVELPFLQHASGVVFLLDAWDFSTVRERIGPLDGASTRPVLNMQTRLLRAVADDFGLVADRLDSLPVAFAINKADLIHAAFGEIDPVLWEPEAGGDARRGQMETIGRAVATQVVPMLDGGGRGIRAAIDQFGNASLHLIATLGFQPDSSGVITEARPHRLVDPLLWVLNQIVYGRTEAQAGRARRPWRRG